MQIVTSSSESYQILFAAHDENQNRHTRTWYDVPSGMLPPLRRVKMAGPSDTLIPTTRLYDVIKQTIAVEIFITLKTSNLMCSESEIIVEVFMAKFKQRCHMLYHRNDARALDPPVSESMCPQFNLCKILGIIHGTPHLSEYEYVPVIL
jgi:hypothetical protein